MAVMKRFMVWDEAHSDSSDGSGPVGFYDTKDEAESAADKACETFESTMNWYLEHQFFVLDLEKPDGWSRFRDA